MSDRIRRRQALKTYTDALAWLERFQVRVQRGTFAPADHETLGRLIADLERVRPDVPEEYQSTGDETIASVRRLHEEVTRFLNIVAAGGATLKQIRDYRRSRGENES